MLASVTKSERKDISSNASEAPPLLLKQFQDTGFSKAPKVSAIGLELDYIPHAGGYFMGSPIISSNKLHFSVGR